MLDKIEKLIKVQNNHDDLEEELFEYVVEHLEIKEDLIDVVETIIENLNAFDNAEHALNVIYTIANKSSSSSSSSKKKKDKKDKKRRDDEGDDNGQ